MASISSSPAMAPSASSGSSSSPIPRWRARSTCSISCASRSWLTALSCCGRPMSFARRASSHIFYGQTTSLCEVCLALVPTKIVFEEDDVLYLKRCPSHGVQKTRVASDIAYFKSCKEWLKPGDRPLALQSRTHYGCPYDCGLCPDHEQHSCLALIEVNEACNLTCPVCFADSSPQRTKQLSRAEVERMLDALVASEGEPDLVQISGGEPTLHPEIVDILWLAKSKPIRHLMLNTNGVRIARAKAFVAELARLKPGFEVYLQFDSLERAALDNIRGADLRRVREDALANLEAAGISTTLVCVVKKGVNDGEIGRIIEHALGYACVRGITFQPVQDAGRNLGFDKNRDRMLLTDIRRAILQQSEIFRPDDLIPLPCNPDAISIGYGLRQGRRVTPITQLIPKDELLAALGYDQVFRVLIVQFLDRFNFCLAAVKRSCIHFVTPAGKIIPFDTYNLFYRNGLDARLRPAVPHD